MLGAGGLALTAAAGALASSRKGKSRGAKTLTVSPIQEPTWTSKTVIKDRPRTKVKQVIDYDAINNKLTKAKKAAKSAKIRAKQQLLGSTSPSIKNEIKRNRGSGVETIALEMDSGAYKPLRNSNKSSRMIQKEWIIKKAGGRKNSKLTPESTWQKYQLPAKKIARNAEIQRARSSVLNGYGKAFSESQLNKLYKNGWDPVMQRIDPKATKRQRAYIRKAFKSRGRLRDPY